MSNPVTPASSTDQGESGSALARPVQSPSSSELAKDFSNRSKWARRIVGLAVLGAAGAAVGIPAARESLLGFYHALTTARGTTSGPAADVPQQETKPWDGVVTITPEQAKTIGLTIETVQPAKEPIRVEIYGNTAYDPNSLVRIRPRFPSVVDQVHVSLGQRIHPGDPLLELFSADLAAAKSEYEKSQAKWEHDRRELERAERLRKTEPPAISERDYLALVNDEKVSRTEAKVAVDKLLVYGLSEEGIANVARESGTEKARLASRSTSDGVVVRRDAVQGNLYNTDETLLVIAPLDHLWVYGHVYPSDASQIAVGQRWVIRVPGTKQEVITKIDAISTELDPQSNTLLIRAQIPNDSGSVKADMLVGGYVEAPPPANSVILPRRGLVSTDGQDYAFVLQGSPGGEQAGPTDSPLRFERRSVNVAIEYHDQAIILDGLSSHERVACRGALILSQLYEDAESSRPRIPAAAANPAIDSAWHLTAPGARVTIR